MTCTTLMVNCELGQQNTLVLNVARELAARFDMRVIGIAVAQPIQIMYGDYYISAEGVEEDIKEGEIRLAQAEEEYRTALASRADQLSWRSATVYASTATHVARESRSADLVVTGSQAVNTHGNQRHLNTGDLVLQSGRPVVIVPPVPCVTHFEHILIAWKDAREARRAVIDALPLLKKAAHVTVVEIDAETDLPETRTRLTDLANWLQSHGVVAETMAVQSSGFDAKSFGSIAQRLDADLVVAGAYGHSRLREWAFGGFTSELMQPTSRCSFVSH